MTEVLFLCGDPARLPGAGQPEPLATRVCARAGAEGLEWVALPLGAPDPEADDAFTLDLSRDLADFADFPELGAALDAWWTACEPRLAPRAPLLVVLPFSCFPRATAAFRNWASRRLRRPLLLVSECLLPVLEGLDRIRALLEARTDAADPLEIGLVCGRERLRVQGSRDRVLRLDVLEREGRPGEAFSLVHEVSVGDRGAAVGRLLESLRSGPSLPVRLRLRPAWCVVPQGSRRELFRERPPRRARTWQASLHLRRGASACAGLDLVCSLGRLPGDRSRVITLPPLGADQVRLDLWLDPRRGRVRVFKFGAQPSGFLEFPFPGLLA